MPDDVPTCPHCGTEVHPKHQLDKEISFRRWQRWFFYFILVLIFVGMGALSFRLYSLNDQLLLEVTNMRGDLDNNTESVKAAQDEANKEKEEYESLKDGLELEIEKLKRDLGLETEKLSVKTSEYAKELSLKEEFKTDYDQCMIGYSSLADNYKSVLTSLGVGISNADLNRFILADFNLGTSEDNDRDGLSDLLEMALGTDVNLMDSDADGYDDKSEALSGFNPAGAGGWPIDNNFAANHKNRVFKQVENNNYYWYIGKDLKRYFLGKVSE